MRSANVKLILAVVAGLSFFTACKKDIQDQPAAVTPPVTNPLVIADSKIKDSALLYARDLYLWYSQIPSTFNAQSYDDPNKIMEAIRAYSIEPGFTAAVDRWSFAYKQHDWDNLSSGIT